MKALKIQALDFGSKKCKLVVLVLEQAGGSGPLQLLQISKCAFTHATDASAFCL